MTYDFDEPVERSGTYATKWNVAPGELPMWVADMDFRTAPEVTEAVVARAKHGVFGYTDIPDEFRQSVACWWRERHGWNVDPQWVDFCTGVVPALSSCVRTLSQPGGKVAVVAPVYNIFFNSILNSGREAISCDLDYADGAYHLDLGALERTLSDPQVRLLIFCNPHNPTGTIWTADELRAVGDICARHGVTVISDEIHCDLTAPGTSYTPFASVSDEYARVSVTCVSASKAFNLAGLQGAAVIIPDDELRARVVKGLNRDEVAESNDFAVVAAIAAFTKGGPWLDELRAYLQANREHATSFIASRIPGLHATAANATYLMWIDCGAICEDSIALAGFLRQETGLILSAGAVYRGNGSRFLRMNLACPRSRLDDGLGRLERGIAAWTRR
jgi:cystathionine beta-lyase